MPHKRGPLSESKGATRIESDSLGTIDVEQERYWGAQTERSRRNFRIGEESMPKPLIRAIALVKKAAALTNRDIGLLEERLATAIATAADEVNLGQSSNDAFPTAMHVSAAKEIAYRLNPALARLYQALKDKAEAFQDILKIGRTHLQDATPLTLGQEFGGYAAQVDHGIERIKLTLPGLPTRRKVNRGKVARTRPPGRLRAFRCP